MHDFPLCEATVVIEHLLCPLLNSMTISNSFATMHISRCEYTSYSHTREICTKHEIYRVYREASIEVSPRISNLIRPININCQQNGHHHWESSDWRHRSTPRSQRGFSVRLHLSKLEYSELLRLADNLGGPLDIQPRVRICWPCWFVLTTFRSYIRGRGILRWSLSIPCTRLSLGVISVLALLPPRPLSLFPSFPSSCQPS